MPDNNGRPLTEPRLRRWRRLAQTRRQKLLDAKIAWNKKSAGRGPVARRPGLASDATPTNSTHFYASRANLPCHTAAGRSGTGRARRAAHAGGRARSLIRLEVRRLLELILGHGDFQLVGLVLGLVARHELEGARRQGDVLRADAEEAADADHVGFDLAVLVEQNVAHVADLLLIGPDHVRALELRREELIGTL